MALKKRGFDALHVHPMYDENQNLEYLPGAPVSQDHEKGEQKGIGKSMGRDLTEDNSYRPSFIPVATTQDQDVPLYTTVDRMARTSQQDSQADNQPVSSSDSMNGNTLASLENYSREQQHSMATTASSVSQNGYVPLAYQDSGSTHINHGMPSHGHIVMYPPSQVTFTHAGRRETSTVQPQLIAAGIPTKPHIPPVQHQLVQASSSTKVVPSGPSTPPSHSPHQRKQDQVQSHQPTVVNAIEPRPGGPQGFPAQWHLLESQGHAGEPTVANAIEPRSHGPQGRHPQVQGRAGEPAVANAMEPRPHGPQGRHPEVQGHAGEPTVANAMEPKPSGPQGFPAQGHLPASQGHASQPAIANGMEPRPHGPQGRHLQVQGHAGQQVVVNAMEPRPHGPQGRHPQVQGHAGQPVVVNAMEPRPHGPQGRHPQVQGHAGQPVVVNAMQLRPHGPQGRHPQVQGHAGQPAVANVMEPRPCGPQGGHPQVQRQVGQSAVATAMEPMQGSLIPPKGAYPRFSEAVPSTLPLHVDDSRLAFLNHVTMPEAIGKAGQAVTSSQSLSLLHHQHQPPQQVLTQPFPRVEDVPKYRGFAPLSRTMIGGIPANHQLRERLQNLANRQRSLATRSGDQDIGNLQGMEGIIVYMYM